MAEAADGVAGTAVTSSAPPGVVLLAAGWRWFAIVAAVLSRSGSDLPAVSEDLSSSALELRLWAMSWRDAPDLLLVRRCREVLSYVASAAAELRVDDPGGASVLLRLAARELRSFDESCLAAALVANCDPFAGRVVGRDNHEVLSAVLAALHAAELIDAAT